LTTKPSIDFTGTDFDSQITLRVLKTTTYQTVLGFGGAFTEAAAYVFFTNELYRSTGNTQCLLWTEWEQILCLQDTH